MPSRLSERSHERAAAFILTISRSRRTTNSGIASRFSVSVAILAAKAAVLPDRLRLSSTIS